MKPRPGISYRVVLVVFFATLAAALIVAGGLYFDKLHYRRVAAEHIPGDAVLALRVDVEKVLTFEPVRHHLLPLVDSAGAPQLEPSRSKRVQAATRIELAVDLREALVAVGPGEGDWVLVLGGLFPREGVVEGVARTLSAEGRSGAVRDGVYVDGRGFALAQAADGAVLVGSSLERVTAARAPERGPIDLTGAPGIAEVAWAPGAEGVFQRLGLGPMPPAGSLRAIVGTQVDLAAWSANDTGLPALLVRLGAASVTERSEPEGPVVSGTLERETLDRAAARLARWLAPRLAASSR